RRGRQRRLNETAPASSETFQRAPVQAGRARTTGAISARAHVHLMVVEDDLRLQAVLKRLFESDNHVVDLIDRGNDALDILLAPEAGMDAIVLDLGLPDISGVEVTRRLRAARSRIPILVLTARDALDQRIAGLDAGADDYMVKPFAYGELVARLRAIVRRASPAAER